MKQLILPFFGALLLLSCANGEAAQEAHGAGDGHAHNQDSANQAALQDSSRFASIQWIDSIQQTVGKVKKGEVKDVAWRFRNTGSHPLVIAHVQPGCGCTVADQPKAPIAPGEEGVIRAKFDTRSQSTGLHNKNVMVQANTSDRHYYLLFTAEVVE